MKKIPGLVLSICFLMMACHNEPAKDKKTAPKADTSNYYRVDNFFQGEIRDVDLRGLLVKQIRTVNGKKDSGVINSNQFLAWGGLFSRQAGYFKQNRYLYKESLFDDLSTGSYTLTYSPREAIANGIQTVDVLLNRNTNQPTRVFIKTTHVAGDTATTEQYSWKTGKGFQFTRFITAHNFSSVELTEVSWQNPPARQK